jgi:hypothetical protein
MQDGTCPPETGEAHTCALGVCVRWRYSLPCDRQTLATCIVRQVRAPADTPCGPWAATTVPLPYHPAHAEQHGMSMRHRTWRPEAIEVSRDTGHMRIRPAREATRMRLGRSQTCSACHHRVSSSPAHPCTARRMRAVQPARGVSTSASRQRAAGGAVASASHHRVHEHQHGHRALCRIAR